MFALLSALAILLHARLRQIGIGQSFDIPILLKNLWSLYKIRESHSNIK